MTPRSSAIGVAPLAIAVFGALARGVHAQSQTEDKDPLTFDGASVKPSVGCPPACGLIRQMPGGLRYHGGAFRVSASL